MAQGPQLPAPSLTDNDFVVLSGDAESLAAYQMTLLDRAADASEAQGLARKVVAATLRVAGWRVTLAEQRTRLVALRDAVTIGERRFEERERQLAEREKQLAGEMKHFAEQENGRRDPLSDQERRRAENLQLAQDLKLARAEAATAQAELARAADCERRKRAVEVDELMRRNGQAMEAERAKFLGDLEALAAEQKRLGRLCEAGERLRAAEAAAAAAPAEAEAELLARISQMKDQIAAEKTKRTQAEASNLDLQQMVDRLREETIDHKRKFEALMEQQLELLESQKEAKRQIQARIDEQDKASIPALPHRRSHRQKQSAEPEAQSLRQTCQQQEAKLQAADRQLDELRRELDSVRLRERELDCHCRRCDRNVAEVLLGAERYRKDTEVELTALRVRAATSAAAVKDFAVKMQEKADAEFQLRTQLRQLTEQLAEARRTS